MLNNDLAGKDTEKNDLKRMFRVLTEILVEYEEL